MADELLELSKQLTSRPLPINLQENFTERYQTFLIDFRDRGGFALPLLIQAKPFLSGGSHELEKPSQLLRNFGRELGDQIPTYFTFEVAEI